MVDVRAVGAGGARRLQGTLPAGQPLAASRGPVAEAARTYGVGLIRAADRSGGIRVKYPPRSLKACRLVLSQRLRPMNSK